MQVCNGKPDTVYPTLTQSSLINDGVIELLSLIEFCNAADPAESRVRVREESAGNKDGLCESFVSY